MNRLTTEQVCLSRAAKMVVAYPVGKEWHRVAKSGKSGEKWRKVAKSGTGTPEDSLYIS
jgi:hypothetical protein